MKPSSHYRLFFQRQPNTIKRALYKQNTPKMPLVVPGITTNSCSSKEEWMNKLIGKKIEESPADPTISFAKKDLPQSHRIVKPGGAITMDYNPDRLNIHVDENDNVRDVNYG
ncbi:uncharacterized protein BDV17DRAFT_260019 [Aspergillus undulatus]|uniref:uncharacterized protein n=1 Tax=Aspergillus undulatus TaxID=1810928 RepID=UPI003CCDF57B